MTPEKYVITSKFNKQAVLDSINFLFKSLRITMGAVKNRHQAAHTTNNKIRPNKQYCGNATTSSYYKKISKVICGLFVSFQQQQRQREETDKWSYFETGSEGVRIKEESG
jgi:hypothetical protein